MPGQLASAQFRAIVATALIVMLGFGLIIPALPLFAKEFGVGEAGVGVLVMAFAATRLLGNIGTSPLIRRLGERRMSSVGLVIVGISSIAAAMSQSYVQLVVLRGLGGIGSAFFFGGIMAHLVATVPSTSRGRSMSIFQSSISIGLLIGPALGGALIAFTDERMPLYVYGAMCLLCAPLIERAMHPNLAVKADMPLEPEADEGSMETMPQPRLDGRAAFRPLVRNRAYVAALACGAVAFMHTAALSTLISLFWREEVGGSKGTVGMPFTVLALASLVVLYHAGGVSDRRGRKFTLIPSLAVLAATFAVLGFATSGALVLVIMAVNGLAVGYMRPNPSSMVADIATYDQRAVAVAGYRISNDIGALIGPVVAGTVAELAGYKAAFLTIAAITALVAAFTATVRETHIAEPV